MSGSLAEIVTFNLADDYFATLPGQVRALSVAALSDAAKKLVHPDRLVWVVVGDRVKIEPRLRELGWGDISLIDTDGNAVN